MHANRLEIVNAQQILSIYYWADNYLPTQFGKDISVHLVFYVAYDPLGLLFFFAPLSAFPWTPWVTLMPQVKAKAYPSGTWGQ